MWELSQNEDKRDTKETLAWWMGRTRACRSALCSIALWGSCNGKLDIGFFSLLREKYIWNIWTQIKWEAKLTNLSELFER